MMHSLLSNNCGDDTFGPIVASNNCRYGLDFTLLFEEAFLVIAPCSIFIISAVIRIMLLRRHSVMLEWDRNLGLKLILASLLSVAQIADLLSYTLKLHEQVKTTLAAVSLDLVSSLVICILIPIEHVRSTKPSTLLSLFLALKVLFDIVRVRSFSMMTQMSTILIMSSISMGLKLSLLVAECWRGKSVSNRQNCKKKSSEQEMGILSNSLMLWLLPVFRLGYTNSIELEDLPSIPHDLRTSKVAKKASKSWSCARQDKKHALAITTFWIARKTLLLQMIPRLCLVGFSIAQPFLIERFIENISKKTDFSALFFIGAFALVYIGIAISRMWYQLLTNRTIMMMRGSLISLIYAKTLQLSTADLADSSAVSLLTADLERISTSIKYVQNVWADVIQIGLATYILSLYVNVVCVAAVIVALISSIAAGQVSKTIGPRQRVWFDKGRERIGSTTKLLDEIRSIKWSGLESKVQSSISELRADQISAQMHLRIAQTTMIFLGNFPGIATPFVVFLSFAITSYLSSGPPISMAQAFAALSVLSLLIEPVEEIIAILSNFLASLDCFSSIQDYLLKSRPFYADLESRNQDNKKTSIKIKPDLENQSTVSDVVIPYKKDERNSCKISQLYAHYNNVSIAVQGPDGFRIVLRQLTFCIPTGQLTMIAGPTGCGKSTLMKSFFKETSPVSGELFVGSGAIAFCSQSPWIMNTTIRENITGPYAFDQSWYSTVLNACCLSGELHKFMQGDETVVGSKGGSLSGGQMARLALARAVYSRAPVVMLDEPFSSLDPVTEERCFRQLLGPSGLLSNGSITVILVSIRKKWLAYAGNTVILDDNGYIIASGPQNLEKLALPATEVCELREKIDQTDIILQKEAKSKAPETDSILSNIQDGSKQASVIRMKDTRLIPYYLNTIPSWLFAILLLMMVAQVVFIAIQPLWLNFWIRYNINIPNQSIGYYFGIYTVFVVASLAFLYGCDYLFFLVLVPLSSQKLHDRLLGTTLEAPLSFFQYTKTGTILNHFTQDLMLVDMILPLSLLLALENGMASFVQLVLTSISTGYVALAIPGILLVLFSLQHVYLRTSKQIRLLELATKAPIYDHITETISGINTIRLLAWQDYFTSKNYAFVDDSQSPYYIMLCIQKWLTLVLNLVVAGLAIILTTTVIALQDRVNPGLIGVSLISIVGLGGKLSCFVTYWTSLETSLGAVSRIKSYSDQTPKHDALGQSNMDPDWPQHGNIQITNLSAGYSEQTVLHGITCNIPRGQKVKLYGPSGSGKTSLAASLLRFIETKKGQIAIDGKDISVISAQSLHRAVFALPQTLSFVSRTVRGNLTSRVQHAVTDLDLEQVLRSVSLWTRICSLPDGLDTVWDANLLSPGQKQLFAFAQALLSRCPIIIVDEISSYLDDETVNIIQQLLSFEFSDRTILMITHDTRQGFKYDRSIRLENGRVVLDDLR